MNLVYVETREWKLVDVSPCSFKAMGEVKSLRIKSLSSIMVIYKEDHPIPSCWLGDEVESQRVERACCFCSVLSVSDCVVQYIASTRDCLMNLLLCWPH